MPENNVNPKKGLRQELLVKRLALTPEYVQKASHRVRESLRALAVYQEAASLLLYLPIKNELDLRPLLPELWERGARVLLPRCLEGEAGTLEIACLNSLGELRPGRYGILEPDPAACPALGSPCVDLALVPGLAFDRLGGRLGFGAGYYDRLLAGQGFERTVRLGLCYDFGLFERLPSDPWDAPMQAICTEKEFLWINP